MYAWRAMAAVAAMCWSGSVEAGALADVKARKAMLCGVHIEKPGFATADAQGRIGGFDVDFCKAIAAAIGVEAKLSPLSPNQRFTALTTGAVDVLLMTTTQTMNRDTKLATDWAFINFYGGGMLMVRKSAGVKSARELNGASVCLSSGTTADQFLADFFRGNRLTYRPVMFEKLDDGFRAYAEGRCDAFTQDDASLAAMRATLPNPDDHVILPETLSKEPVGAVTRDNDSEWNSALRWIFQALVNAEEKGVTQANVEDLAKNSTDPDVKRMLGGTGTLGVDAGLPADFAVLAIKAVGNYGEIFDRHLGAGSRFKMPRGANELWTRGGLMYGMPMR